MSKRWSKKEIKYLESISDWYSPSEVINRCQAWAKRNNLPVRTRKSISLKLSRLGLCASAHCAEKALSRRALRDNLGIGRHRLEKLIELGLPVDRKSSLVPTQKAKDWFYWNKNISLAAPYLEGANKDFLDWWLGPVIVRRIKKASYTPLKNRTPKKVLINGKVYVSLTAASKALYLSRSAIPKAIERRQETIDDKHFHLMDS